VSSDQKSGVDYKAEWERECADADRILLALCLDPAKWRTEGGSLRVNEIVHRIRLVGLVLDPPPPPRHANRAAFTTPTQEP
jgi:hypothetical protein